MKNLAKLFAAAGLLAALLLSPLTAAQAGRVNPAHVMQDHGFSHVKVYDARGRYYGAYGCKHGKIYKVKMTRHGHIIRKRRRGSCPRAHRHGYKHSHARKRAHVRVDAPHTKVRVRGHRVKVDAPYTRVRTHGRRVKVDAPHTKVRVKGRHVRVRAPYTNVSVKHRRVHVRAPYVNVRVRY